MNHHRYAAIAFSLFLSNNLALAEQKPSSHHQYRSVPQIEHNLLYLAKNHKNADLIKIGETLQGKPLLILRIKNSHAQGQPGMFIVGGHHGNEQPSPEVVIELAHQILGAPQDHGWVNRDLYLMPLASPTALSTKSRHTHSHDLNRDYPYPGRSVENPAFKTLESRAIDKFLRNTPISHAITVHSGIKAVLYPNGFQNGGLQPTTQETFKKLALTSAQAMGIQRAIPMWDSYPTYGAFIDYAYHTHGIMALNFEVSVQHSPPKKQLGTIHQSFQSGVQAFFSHAFSKTSKDATIAATSHKVPKVWPQSTNSTNAQ